MADTHEILNVIYQTVDIVNRQLKNDQKLSKSQDTIITGERSSLNSLGLISFITELEEQLSDTLDITINLTNEDILSQNSEALKNIGTLAEYITRHINE